MRVDEIDISTVTFCERKFFCHGCVVNLRNKHKKFTELWRIIRIIQKKKKKQVTTVNIVIIVVWPKRNGHVVYLPEVSNIMSFCY